MQYNFQSPVLLAYAGLCVASLQASDLPRLQCAGHNLSQAPPSDRSGQ